MAFSNSESIKKTEEYDICFILSTVKDLLNNSPDSALIWINEGLGLSERQGDTYHLGVLYIQKGLAIQSINPDKALKCFFRAMHIMKQNGHSRGLVSAYTQIGSALGANQPDKQMVFYKKALKLALELEIPEDLSQIFASLGGLFIMKDNMDSAEFYLQRGLNYAISSGYHHGIAVNQSLIAEINLRNKKYNEAKELLLYALKYSSEDYTMWVRQSLIEVYLKMDREDSAIYHFNTFKDKLHLRPDIQTYTYFLFSEFYQRSEDYKQAFLYRKLADSVKTAMDEKSTKNMLSLLEMESAAKIQKAEMAKLNSELDKANIIRIFLVVLLITSFLFTYQQRLKNKKSKEAILLKKHNMETQKELLEAELRNAEMQKQYLSDELKYTNKELISFATNITQSQTLINDLKKQLGDISKEKDGKKVKARIREMKIMLTQTFNNDEQREEFIRKSRQLNHSLVFYLKTNYPELTETDINLLILLLLKFSSKEIAALYNIEMVSAKQKRYRIRKKLGLETEKSWEDFFDKVLADLELKITG